MSGVYIQGMKMPENCYQCPFGADVDIGVGVAHGCNLIKDFAQFANERHPDCPLIPVHDHGRLIDADALLRDNRSAFVDRDGYPEFSYSAVTDAPTIIPAGKDINVPRKEKK